MRPKIVPHHFTCDKIGSKKFDEVERGLRLDSWGSGRPQDVYKVGVSCILQNFKNTYVLSIELVFEWIKYITFL